MRTFITLLVFTFSLATLNAALPTITLQPAGGVYPKGSYFTYRIHVNSDSNVTLSYPDGVPYQVLQGSVLTEENSRTNNNYTFMTSFNINADEDQRKQFRITVTNDSGSVTSGVFTVTIASQLFRNATPLGNGIFKSSSLGIVYLGNPPYVFQNEGLGNFFLTSGATFDAWFYPTDFSMGWFYYNPLSYPWMFNTEFNSWVLFVYREGGRFFYIVNTDTWITR